jgi:3-hydroxybutyryl-CoA dehydrogenase
MKKIGIIGAGSMGAGIAQVAANAECDVLLYDNSYEVCLNALKKLDKILSRLIEKGKITDDKKLSLLKNISIVKDLSSFSDCDLVIEAIIENEAIKKEIFSSLSKLVSKDCIIASNTSSLSITNLASSCLFSERFIGIHFFNPAPLMPLVEVIPALQTSQVLTNKVYKLIKDWGKSPVIAKDTPGFIVNRIARPFYGEALRIYEEGFADFKTIDQAMKEFGGFRMGPFELMDFIGNDVNYAVTSSVFKAFYYDPRYKPSFTQRQYAEAKWLGRKTNKGYYDYNTEDDKLLISVNPELAKKIVDRILVMLINEAVDALYLGIANENDIEVAMTKGVNYPKGLLQWAKEVSYSWCVDHMDTLYEKYHEDRYRCSPLLRDLAKKS